MAEMSKQLADLKSQLDEMKTKFAQTPAAKPATTVEEPKTVEASKFSKIENLKKLINKK
jgi:hypothetical protein